MRVLMLGWEFPPFITGGLGTACYGLTKALDRRGIDVTFVLPKHVDEEHAGHVTLVSPSVTGAVPDALTLVESHGVSAAAAHAEELRERVGAGHAPGATVPAGTAAPSGGRGAAVRVIPSPVEAFAHVTFLGVPMDASSVYASTAADEDAPDVAAGSPARAGSATGSFVGSVVPPAVLHAAASIDRVIREVIPEAPRSAGEGHFAPRAHGDYSGDLISEAERYARFVVAACGRLKFDVIHAHDWLTYPAGLALARVSGRPLVVHVHSTEFDRSGLHVNQRVYDIERRGMHGAIRIVSVSMLTKNLCTNRYGVPADKIDVVYNGVDLTPQQVGMEDIASQDKIVLYFGRITMQKGPEYFIQAAKRVLEVMPSVKFVVAGSGDQARNMIELAASLGIGQKVLFTGFLRGKDIARVFALADLYVMPSVSEPFGIAPLEAMGHDVPVLISKTSGVSEVLTHALKCDFWDVDEMANKIVAVLRHPPLSNTLREHGRFEVRKLTWDGAADRCEQVYHGAVAADWAPWG